MSSTIRLQIKMQIKGRKRWILIVATRMMMMMMIWWWWWWLMMMMMMNILEKTAQITLCWGRPPQSLRVVKTELTLLGGLATACSRPCDQNKRQLSQHSLRLHFLLCSSFLKVPDYFFASLMLLMMIDELSSERVHDKNIRKVIKHFQKRYKIR